MERTIHDGAVGCDVAAKRPGKLGSVPSITSMARHHAVLLAMPPPVDRNADGMHFVR